MAEPRVKSTQVFQIKFGRSHQSEDNMEKTLRTLLMTLSKL
jgi:hypothetical protein